MIVSKGLFESSIHGTLQKQRRQRLRSEASPIQTLTLGRSEGRSSNPRSSSSNMCSSMNSLPYSNRTLLTNSSSRSVTTTLTNVYEPAKRPLPKIQRSNADSEIETETEENPYETLPHDVGSEDKGSHYYPAGRTGQYPDTSVTSAFCEPSGESSSSAIYDVIKERVEDAHAQKSKNSQKSENGSDKELVFSANKFSFEEAQKMQGFLKNRLFLSDDLLGNETIL